LVAAEALVRKARRKPAEGVEGEIVSFERDGRALSAGEAIAGLRDDGSFRDLFIAALAASPYRAFFWEMPPVSRDALAAPFECALIPADALLRPRASDADFASHLNAADAEQATAFPNLGGDALLIAPRRISDADCYAHLAAFLRLGPRPQIHSLLALLGKKAMERLEPSSNRFWISTSGLGVPWVHVRLDRYPKYYQYGPYAA
jgi:hypothetical protein